MPDDLELSLPDPRPAASPRSVRRGEPDYPAPLERLSDPPERLRVRGALPDLSRAVAIVGTRRATELGCRFARELAATLARAGCPIVSGGALGIDRAAHEGALDEGRITVVVHGSGLAQPYPEEHRALFAAAAREGCELSEREDHETPRSFHFLQRNRLIAALSRVVVVVEAPERSGALSTARHALELGIPLLVAPAWPHLNEARGGLALLRGAARVCLDATDVLALLEGGASDAEVSARASVTRRPARERATRARSDRAAAQPSVLEHALTEGERRVLEAVRRGVSDVDALVAALGAAVDRVQVDLAELELRGLVRTSPRGTLEVLG